MERLNSASLRLSQSREARWLVIAGAGSGKTRTIVYRVAWLVEDGVQARFNTAAHLHEEGGEEMLSRAAAALGRKDRSGFRRHVSFHR